MILMFYKKSKLFENKSFLLKNISFYVLLSLLIFSIHVLHIALHFSENITILSKLLVMAFFESSLEGVLLCLVGSFFAKSKILHAFYVVFASFFPVIHLIDFMLERLFNLSVWQTIVSFFSESWHNMLELLYATNFPMWSWVLGFFVLGLMGAFFIFVYNKMLVLDQKFNKDKIFKVFLTFSCLLFLVYVPLKSAIQPGLTLHFHVAKVLPFKNFLTQKVVEKEDLEMSACRSPKGFTEYKNGNQSLFIFMIESLRDDCINQNTAPYMYALGQEYFRHPYCFSGANGTHLSWFSFFFSQPAMFWKTSEALGSPFIKNLKDNGYTINVLSSARLKYYDMDTQIFGQNLEYIDDLYCPKMNEPLTAFEADKLCFEKMTSKIKTQKNKQLFIVFLDATHFGYSLPHEADLKFQPSSEKVPYFASVFTKVDILGIKNRYLNTIYALDKLMGQFVDDLKKENLFEDSMILVTADHGEEFYEKGQLFHASHLSQEQLRIPFILKTPHGYTGTIGHQQTLSHMDMLPLMGSVLKQESFEDKTIQICSRYNFSQTPKETVIVSKEGKKLFVYDEKCRVLKLVGLFDTQDNPLDFKQSFINQVVIKQRLEL